MEVVAKEGDADDDDRFVIVPSEEPTEVMEGDFIFLPKQVAVTISPYYQETQKATNYGINTINTKIIEIYK